MSPLKVSSSILIVAFSIALLSGGCASSSHTSGIKITPRTFQLPYELLYVKAIEAVDELGWKMTVTDKRGGLIKLKTGTNLQTWGDIVTITFIEITRGQIRVDVQSTTPNQLVTWGRNTKNIKKFYQKYEALLATADVAAYASPRQRKQSTSGDRSKTQLKATGTGFFITSSGFLITNNHVVKNATTLKVKTVSGIFPARLVKTDNVNDLALLKIEGRFSFLRLKSSTSVSLGDEVFTIGFPNILLQGQEPKFSKGYINSLAGPSDDPRLFQISVPVQPGNSGGPLVDKSGDTVGIIVSKLDELIALMITGALPQNVNYAIKSTYVTAFLQSVGDLPNLSNGKSRFQPSFNDIIDGTKEATALVLVY